jgi:hypothetical protein
MPCQLWKREIRGTQTPPSDLLWLPYKTQNGTCIRLRVPFQNFAARLEQPVFGCGDISAAHPQARRANLMHSSYADVPGLYME